MNGCIYLYRNLVNGKCYVGQTICPIKKRHYDHLHQDSYFDRALKKYGENNFELKILEDNIQTQELLDEREIYYIDKYKSYVNGYNLTLGGQGRTRRAVNPMLASKIADLILNTDLTFKEIGKKCDCSIYQVSEANLGNGGYRLDGYRYPLRSERITAKYTEEQVDLVKEYLLKSDYSFSKIAELVGVDFYAVCDINAGKRRRDSNSNYPLRNPSAQRAVLDEDIVKMIVKMLKDSDMSADQIGEKLGIPGYTVGQINRGKSAWCKVLDETYPIRKKSHRNSDAPRRLCRKLDDKDILSVADMLKNTNVSIEEIAKRFAVSRTTIDRINQGKQWSWVTNEKFPIRRNNKQNLILNE